MLGVNTLKALCVAWSSSWIAASTPRGRATRPCRSRRRPRGPRTWRCRSRRDRRGDGGCRCRGRAGVAGGGAAPRRSSRGGRSRRPAKPLGKRISTRITPIAEGKSAQSWREVDGARPRPWPRRGGGAEGRREASDPAVSRRTRRGWPTPGSRRVREGLVDHEEEESARPAMKPETAKAGQLGPVEIGGHAVAMTQASCGPDGSARGGAGRTRPMQPREPVDSR